ncbi:MAG: MMPL family transporter [Myxococcota bacterium]|nr:MMPL family transporter [Myxococcota bacterium]
MATFAVVGLMAYAAANHIRVDTSVEAFALDEGDAHDALQTFRRDFGSDNLYFVMAEGPVFSTAYLTRLKALHTRLANLDVQLLDYDASGAADDVESSQSAAIDDDFEEFDDDEGWGDEAVGTLVEQTISLVNARDTRFQNDTLDVGELLTTIPEATDLSALRMKVLNDKTMVGQMVGRSGRHAVVGIRMPLLSQRDADIVAQAVERIALEADADGFKTVAVGLPPLNETLNRLMLTDLGIITVAAVLTMFLVLMYLFRHPLGILPPLFVVLASAIITGGSVALSGFSLTMLSNILPAFLFCVGIGHSVHLISVYRDTRAEGVQNHEAIVHAVATTGVPIFYTSLTTMVGLLSFHFASLSAIREMGYMGAYAVLVAFILSLTILPAALTFNTTSLMGRKPRAGGDFIDGFLRICLNASGTHDDPGVGPPAPKVTRRRRRALVAMVAVLLMGLVGASQLRVWHNPLSWVPETEPVRQAFDRMDKHIGGTASVTVLIDAQPGYQVKDRRLLLGLEALEAHIRAYRDPEKGAIVGNAISVLDVVKESWRAYNGNRSDAYRIPPTQAGVSDMLEMFQNTGADDLRRMTVTDLSRTQMTMRVHWMEATAYRRLTDHIEAGIEAHIPTGFTAQATGSVYTLVTTIEQLLWDLMKSFGVAFVVITMIMMVLLGGFKLGCIAMVPNLMPIIVIMGIMGLTEIPIDMSTLLIASISIGLAVDDTIHFLHHFRVNHQASGNLESAIRQSMTHSGRAMVSTTIILMLGFFTYMAADMANISRFGFLVGTTALLALLIDLFFAPALLRTFYHRSPSEEFSHDFISPFGHD